VFGNLIDLDSEIRHVLAHKAVFGLKEELGTEPKFWYFSDDPASTRRAPSCDSYATGCARCCMAARPTGGGWVCWAC
jgi:hypothetical protein